MQEINLLKVNFNKISDGFGSRFLAVLKKNNITQAKFASDTNSNKGLVSRYINGERPSGDFIIKAVAYFPEELIFLFFGDQSGIELSAFDRGRDKELGLISEIESKLEDLRKELSQK